MNFSLSYSGSPGFLNATLFESGLTVATTTGLKDARAAKKWARREARDHRIENTPEATENHYVSISGSQNFTL